MDSIHDFKGELNLVEESCDSAIHITIIGKLYTIVWVGSVPVGNPVEIYQ